MLRTVLSRVNQNTSATSAAIRPSTKAPAAMAWALFSMAATFQ
jgi:hypothetical protein